MRDAGGTRELMSARAGTAPGWIDPRRHRERERGGGFAPPEGSLPRSPRTCSGLGAGHELF